MTTRKIEIARENLTLLGSLRAGSELSQQPAANLQHPVGRYRWQTAGSLDSWVELDNGSAKTIRFLSLHLTNFTAAVQVRFMLGTTAGAFDVKDVPLFTPTITAGVNQVLYELDQDYSARHVRIEIKDPTNPDGFFYVGFVFAGTLVAMNGNFQYPASFGRESGNVQVRTRGGQEHDIVRWSRRSATLSLPRVTLGEMYPEVYRVNEAAANGDNVLVRPLPGGANEQFETIYGRLVPLARPVLQNVKHFAWDFTVNERL